MGDVIEASVSTLIESDASISLSAAQLTVETNIT